MATYNATEHSTTTFVATPVQLDQNGSAGAFGTTASHFITTSTPSMLSSSNNLHRQTTSSVTSNSTSSSYTFLQIKREPCQVSEVTTSNHCQQQQQQMSAAAHHHQQQQQQHHQGVCSATSSTSISATAGSKTVSASTLTTLVKIEPPSPKVPEMIDKGPAGSTLAGNTNNSVPIGIAVARKRPQESSAPTLASCNSSAIPLSQTLSKDLNCFGIRVADLGGVGTGCGNIFFTGNGDLMTGPSAATAEELALQSVNRAPSTIWQYPGAALPFESVISMSPATVGLQYSREASRAAGQVVLLPAATAAALGISNIPPLCYTPTDPFQQAAAAAALVWPSAAAAYLPQGAAPTPTAATLQSPHNFIFPTMNTAHTAAAATLQPQSYAAAASLQLFGSNYLRNATEFMAAAGKTTTTTQQNHMIAAAAAGTTPATLTMPPTPVGGTTALSFETRDKTTMTTTTTTNLLELQGNTQTALNLIRLPTPPTSATIGDGHNTAAQLHTTPQILFQAASSPAPTLLNLSTTGPNAVATTLSRTPAVVPPSITNNVAVSNNFLNNAASIGPPTPVGDEPSTNAPLALNFKTTSVGTDATNASSIVVGVPRMLTSVQTSLTNNPVPPQPQMQDVNIQTDTPVCSEDENSSCPLTALQQHQQQQQTTQILTNGAVSGDACLTPPHHNCTMGNEKLYIESDEAREPLELTKTKSCTNESSSNNENNVLQQSHSAKTNAMCHNEKHEMISHVAADVDDNEIGKRVGGKVDSESHADTSEILRTYEPTQDQQQIQPQTAKSACKITAENDTTCTTSSTADDFAGLELLSNISASSLPNKAASDAGSRGTNITSMSASATILRVKQEPVDAIEDMPQQEPLMLPTIAAKIEQNVSTVGARVGVYERPPLVPSPQSNMPLAMPATQLPIPVSAIEPPSVTEPLGGLNLLCALVEQRIQEEEEEQGASFFAPSSTSQRASPLSSFDSIPQQQQTQILQHQSPYRTEQSSFPSMEGIELPTANSVDIPTAAKALSSPPPPTLHVKRKKHKHSKSSKSSKSSTTSTSSAVALVNGIVSPSILCGGKNSKRGSKKNKKKYSKEKKRQQRAEAAAATAELDFEDEQLQQELQNAFISGTASSGSSGTTSSNVKWPSAQEIFNIMESRMRQRLADITRQYRKKKRKLDEISKTQRNRKKCSKLIAQQLQQQMQLQQQSLLSSPLTAATLSLNGNTNAPSLGDYKFTSKFSSPASAGPSSTTTTSPYLQPSSFPLRFPPLSASTADEDSDKTSHSNTKKRNPIYKPVRLEPSSLSAAVAANGANNNNNINSSNSSGNINSNINGTNSNNNSSTNGIDTSNYNLSTTLRLAQKHPSSEPPVLTHSSKERKLMSKEKVTRRTLADEKGQKTKIKKAKVEKEAVVATNTASATTIQQHPRSETDQQLTLTNEHLYQKETRVLTDMGGLFYAGVMKPLQPPDIYAITLDGERGNKPHIMSREEIFKDTILEVSPKSVSSVPIGTRLCAYWSQQYRCLYPGRAIESESSEGDDTLTEKDFVSVEFDDGDSGRIRLQNIRLLLSDYPIVEYNDNPLYSLGKQKKSGLKNGSHHHIGSNITSSDCNTGAQLFDTKLVHPTTLPFMMSGGDGDTEMYARRTEKKRLKKNPKKKAQVGIVPLNSVTNNICSSTPCITTATPASPENVEHNRKHHKHKKHKKHKKHHRKAEEAAAAMSFAVHSKKDLNDIPAQVELNHQDQQKISNIPAVPLKPIKLENSSTLENVRVKTEQLDDMEEESASNMMSENSDEVKGDEEDDEIEHNNSKGSKIAAFLPERQLWGWLGTAYRKAGVKGRARKQFYKTIKRGKELITVGDCAVFLSTGRPDRPYIGRIESMWETASSNKVVRVKWFYHPEETTGCPNLKYPGALFESPHEDENDVQTISHRCEVLPFERYFEKFGADAKQYQSIYDNNDTYYLAGYYNPKVQSLNLQENIPTTTAIAPITLDSKNTNGDKVNKGSEKKHMSTSKSTSIP